MLYLLLYPLHTAYPILNVFRYISFRTIYALLTALAICLVVGPRLIAWLERHHVGQQIQPDVSRHLPKSGTPTMGGVMILIAICCATLLWANLREPYVWVALATVMGFGLIGFWDDTRKVMRHRHEGLTAGTKLILQVIVAFGISLILTTLPAHSTTLTVPFLKFVQPDLGWFYVVFATLVIVGASNAVNLTDGLDGLAIGPVLIAALTYLVVAYVTGHKKFAEYLLLPHVEGVGELAVFCGAMVGASLGFLWFNTYPATVFMGDVGSLPLGGALGMVAVSAKQELLLTIVGGLFVMEAVSVIFQVASFRSRGKRVFLMAPIHHHFELKGWQEPKIVVRFWIIAVILALLGLSTLKLR